MSDYRFVVPQGAFGPIEIQINNEAPFRINAKPGDTINLDVFSAGDRKGWVGGQAPFSDMPHSQLLWFINNPDPATPTNAAAAQAELERRFKADPHA